MEKKEYKKICISMDLVLLEKLKNFCKRNRRKTTELIEDAVEVYLLKKDK